MINKFIQFFYMHLSYRPISDDVYLSSSPRRGGAVTRTEIDDVSARFNAIAAIADHIEREFNSAKLVCILNYTYFIFKYILYLL